MSEQLPFEELVTEDSVLNPTQTPELAKGIKSRRQRQGPTERKHLRDLGVSTAPLIPQEIADEPTLILPADNAERFSEAVWQGESLKLILNSARRYAEDVLFQIQWEDQGANKTKLRFPHSPYLQEMLLTPEQKEVLSILAEVEAEIQTRWQELMSAVENGIEDNCVGPNIGGWLDEFKLAVMIGVGQVDQKAFHGTATQQKMRKIARYPIHTGEEWQEILHATSDGKTLRHYIANAQAGTLRHQRPNANYYTELCLSDEERRAGHDTGLLLQAASALDADDGLICLCISQLLAPPSPLPPNTTAAAWIDLNEVAIKALGGYAPNEAEAQKRRAKVYGALRYFTRTHVGGQRKVEYFDKQSKRKLDTQIYTTPWQIVSRQEEPLTLFPGSEAENIPLRVELVASRRWLELTTQPSTAQYLPFGELIGAIPANQPGGAWARVLGLAYLYWCRCHLVEATQGAAPRSRRELLDQYPSKVAPYQEILGSKNPRRALDYWRGAESYLRETEIIETDAASDNLPRQNWQEQWLSTSPPWKPGPRLRLTLEILMKNKFIPAPRALHSPYRPKKKIAKSKNENNS